MLILFTLDEINAYNATGKKPNKEMPAKPKFDPIRYNAVSRYAKKYFPEIDDKIMVLKVQAIKQKFEKKV